jgi:hypothetical protein
MCIAPILRPDCNLPSKVKKKFSLNSLERQANVDYTGHLAVFFLYFQDCIKMNAAICGDYFNSLIDKRQRSHKRERCLYSWI